MIGRHRQRIALPHAEGRGVCDDVDIARVDRPVFHRNGGEMLFEPGDDTLDLRAVNVEDPQPRNTRLGERKRHRRAGTAEPDKLHRFAARIMSARLQTFEIADPIERLTHPAAVRLDTDRVHSADHSGARRRLVDDRQHARLVRNGGDDAAEIFE